MPGKMAGLFPETRIAIASDILRLLMVRHIFIYNLDYSLSKVIETFFFSRVEGAAAAVQAFFSLGIAFN